MCVLSRVLYGDLQCLSLDLPGDKEEEQEAAQAATAAQQQQQRDRRPSASSMFHHPYQAFQAARDHIFGGSHQQHYPPEGARRAYKNAVSHLHAPAVGMLFPYKGNLHEFFAGPNGAAVLDILLPPYDVEHDRDCTFYDVKEDPAAAQRHQQAHTDDERTPCWIIPTSQPHDFHCLSGKYHKLGSNAFRTQDHE